MSVTVKADEHNTKNILSLLEEMGCSLPCNCHGRRHCDGRQYSFDCTLIPKEPVTVELPESAPKLSGIALEDKIAEAGSADTLLIDLGTTTVALALIDSVSGALRQTCVFANPQTAFGADVVSRIQAACFRRAPRRHSPGPRGARRTVMRTEPSAIGRYYLLLHRGQHHDDPSSDGL